MECSEQINPKAKQKQKPKTHSNSVPTIDELELECLKSLEPSSSESEILEEITKFRRDLDDLDLSTSKTTAVGAAETEIKSDTDGIGPLIPDPSNTSVDVPPLQLDVQNDSTTLPELKFPEVPQDEIEPSESEIIDASSASALLPIILEPVTSQPSIDSKIQEDQNAVTDFFRTNYPNFEPLPSFYPSEPALYLIPEDQIDYSKLKYNYKMMKHIIIVEPTKPARVPEPEPKPTSTKANYENLRELIDENYTTEAGRRRREKEDEANSNLQRCFLSGEKLEAKNVQKFFRDPDSCSETINSKDQLSTDSSSKLEVDEALDSKFGLLRELSDLDEDEMILFGSIMEERQPNKSFELKPSTTLDNVLAEIKYWTTAKFRKAWRVLKSIKSRIVTSWKNRKRSRQVGQMVSISDKSSIAKTTLAKKRQSPFMKLPSKSSSSEEFEYLVAQKENRAKAQALMRTDKKEPRNGVKVESANETTVDQTTILLGGIKKQLEEFEADSKAHTRRMTELFRQVPQQTNSAAGFQMPEYDARPTFVATDTTIFKTS